MAKTGKTKQGRSKAAVARASKKYNAKPSSKKARARRNRDRSRAVKKHGKAALKGKDVHHTKKGARGKAVVRSRSANRRDNNR